MKKFVVDASVAAKWFIPEIHSAAASRFLDPEILLCAPDLIVPEFGNVLWKKVRREEITAAEAGEILSAFAVLPIEIHSSAALLPAAFEIAVSLDCTVYDSLYVALAVADECALVTADARLHGAVSATALSQHIQGIEDEI